METLLVTLLLLGILIFVHELGHFVAAKWAGISVPRFSLGLGPRLVGFRIGETDYCLSAIPFGGYVKMAGVEGEEGGSWIEGDPAARGRGSGGRAHGPEEVAGLWIPDVQEDEGRAHIAARTPPRAQPDPSRGFDSKPLWKRLIVILAGVTMNFLFGYAVFVWLAWSQGEALIPTILGTPEPELVAQAPEAAGWRGRTVQAVNDTPVATWNELVEALEATPEGAPVRLRFADGEEAALSGVDHEVLLPGLVPALPPVVGEVLEDGPAGRAGILPGDRILVMDGEPVRIWEDIPDHVRARAGQRISVRVQRGERTLDLDVTPALESAPGPDNKFIEVGFLGVGAHIDARPVGLGEALWQGTFATLRAGGLILHGLAQLFSGRVSFDSIGGPVAIGQITGYYQRQGLDQLLSWMGLFSINLAILNLLPIPVLDGGHVVFFLLPEAIRGRPLSVRLKTRIALAGWVLVGLLMAWAVTSDLTRLVRF